jgi:hypothetical protein
MAAAVTGSGRRDGGGRYINRKRAVAMAAASYRKRAAAMAAAVTESGRRRWQWSLQKPGEHHKRPLQEAGGGRDGGHYIGVNNALRKC